MCHPRIVRHVWREDPFYRCWTRKEAYAKATRDGLLVVFSILTVSLLTGESPRLMQHDLEPIELSGWTLMDLQVGSHAAAALTVEGSGWSVRMLQTWL